jgi:hypothetical protein
MVTMTREQAAAAVAAATAQRDGIQANLLDLDGSFGKRLLAGASLTGATEKRWTSATADLAALWELFTAYSGVVDRAAGVLARGRRPGPAELTEITTLLTGTSVKLTRAPAPLGRRDLTDTGRSELTPATAVRQMTDAFARVTEVVTAAESVWNEVAERLDRVAAELAPARQRAHGLADAGLAGALAAADAELTSLRDVLNSDPLALRQGNRIDTVRLDRLQEQTTAVVSQVSELVRMRAGADGRIAAVTTAVTAARAAEQDAAAARDRAAQKVVVAALPPLPPDAARLGERLAALDGLKAAGRWTRLASELEVIERQAAAAIQKYQDAEREAVALLGRRGELRGLLDAYQAKGARLGAAENSDLAARYDRARTLLWTAPCDLAAAEDAVTGYQQAVLALSERGQRR